MNTMKQMRGMGFVITVAWLLAGVAPAATVTWTGSVNGNWDTSNGNWSGGSPSANLYVDGDDARFTDASAVNAITLAGTVAPGSTTFSNSTARTYVLTGAGTLSAGSFTKDANGRTDLGSSSVAPPTLSFAGGTTVNGGRLNYLVTKTGSSYNFGSGAITLNNNAEFGFSTRDDGGYGNRITLNNNLAVGSTGGTLLTGNASGRFAPALGGTLDLQGDFVWKLRTKPDGTVNASDGPVNPVGLNTITLSGTGVTRKFEVQSTPQFNAPNPADLVYLRRAITDSNNGNTLILNGVDSSSNPYDGSWLLLDARTNISANPITDAGGSCSLNVANLTVQDRVAVQANADADDFFATLRGRSGKVTIATGGNLNLFRGTFRMSDFTFISNSTLTFESRLLNSYINVKLLGDLSVSSTAGDVANLNWVGLNSTSYRQFRNVGDTADGTVTIGNGGALNVIARDSASNPIEYQGNLKFLGGSTLNGTVATQTATDPCEIRQRSAADTFALGDGNINTLETITIKGLHPVANSTGAFIIGTGQSAGQFVDDGNVILRYESTGATTNKSFNIAWNTTTDMSTGGTVMKNINVALRAGSAGTVFAPEVVAGTTTIKAVGPTNGNVFVTTKPATLVTAGTIGFYNQSANANGVVGNLGPIAINAGGTLAFSTNGTVLASNVTFSTGSMLAVTVVGTVSNAVGYLKVSDSLTFSNGATLSVGNPLGFRPAQGGWYVAEAKTIGGQPSASGFNVEIESGTPQRLKISPVATGLTLMVQ